MFDRPHHRRIAQVLGRLDAPLLRHCGCLFGGGTAIALRHGEYRESVDIDFIVSHLDGYRHLRQLLTGPEGLHAVERERDGPALRTGEIRADQYGVRTMVDIEGSRIKFEIVLEGRITLAEPGPDDTLCGVATLTPLDMAATKLLANADRWRDDGVFSRDLIDLAMMAPALPLLRAAAAKAAQAYGASVFEDLAKAVDQLKTRPGRLERCMRAMAIDMPAAALWQRIRALRRVVPRSAAV